MNSQEENIQRFMQAKEKARKLIQMDAAGEIDRVRDKAVSEGKLSFNENETSQPIEPTKRENIIPNQNVVRNNNLPQEILESMINNKIDTSSLGNGISSTSSVLDQLNSMSNGKLLKNEPKKIIKEDYNNKTNQNIDYSMIKMIIEDCMKKYASTIKKSIINESKKNNEDNSLQAMKIGNKFSFITKNGDLYEANLKFIKNINK